MYCETLATYVFTSHCHRMRSILYAYSYQHRSSAAGDEIIWCSQIIPGV